MIVDIHALIYVVYQKQTGLYQFSALRGFFPAL